MAQFATLRSISTGPTGVRRARGHGWEAPAPSQKWLDLVFAALSHDAVTIEIMRRQSMHVTRRQATLGGLSLLASTAMSVTSLAHVGDFLGLGEGLEDFWLATDAYIYGYPLVTM